VREQLIFLLLLLLRKTYRRMNLPTHLRPVLRSTRLHGVAHYKSVQEQTCFLFYRVQVLLIRGTIERYARVSYLATLNQLQPFKV
jgi:hypothetical protein